MLSAVFSIYVDSDVVFAQNDAHQKDGQESQLHKLSLSVVSCRLSGGRTLISNIIK